MAWRTPSLVFGEPEEIRSLFLFVELYRVVDVWGRITMTLSGSLEFPHAEKNEHMGFQTLLENTI